MARVAGLPEPGLLPIKQEKKEHPQSLIGLDTNGAVFIIFWKIPRTIMIAGNIIMIMYRFTTFRKFYKRSNIVCRIYEAV